MERPSVQVNPLALGFYTVPEAARLIEFGSARRIYGWLRGYKGRAIGPLIERDFEPVEGQEEVSFLDLMELRLIETLREQSVKANTIRKAIVSARELFGTYKPFATDRILLKTDGKSVFVEEILKKAAKEENDKRLWNLITKQYEHYELIEQTLRKGICFDPNTHFAKTWKPRPDLFPSIIIDPRIAYGRPVTPSNIPAETIYEIWKAESENLSSVADWFAIPLDEADSAIKFQIDLLKPREMLAA